MPQPVIFEPQLLHSEQITAKKPWERQEGENARWFMRFRNYVNLGPKRSVNAAFELEHKSKKEKSRTNAGPEWYNAAKRWQWEERAHAWDIDQAERKAAIMQEIAAKCAFVSRPFRIAQLNSVAETMMQELEKGHDPVTFLALSRQMQSLMHDICEEVTAWNITIDASCDAAALDAWQRKRKRMDELQQEREDIMEAELDAKIESLLRQGIIDAEGKYVPLSERRRYEQA